MHDLEKPLQIILILPTFHPSEINAKNLWEDKYLWRQERIQSVFLHHLGGLGKTKTLYMGKLGKRLLQKFEVKKKV
jgi:hypothetical protein